MTGYEEFQQIMIDIEYFKKNGIPKDPSFLKDKDGNSLFDMFENIFGRSRK